jgi:hypothetical protein
MYKIVSSFTRPDTNFEFFNDIFTDYDVIVELHRNAEKLPGYLGIDEHIYRDQFKCDKAMCFKDENSFKEFVENNLILLQKRTDLIAEYCQRTGQEYKYYIIKNEDTE